MKVTQIQFENIRLNVIYAVHTIMKKSDLGHIEKK